MPKVTPLQPSLNAGEFSPRMAARTDFQKYPLACAKLENMLPIPQGGAARRPGTRYVAAVKDSSKKPRLLPFEFSEHQAYVLEAGEGYLRFYKDRGQIVAADTDAAIANGAFDSDLSGWTASKVSHSTDKALFASGGHLTQSVTVTPGNETREHVLTFRIRGIAGARLKLRVGATAGGEEILSDVEFGAGYHCCAFTPGASNTTFHLRFTQSSGAPGLDSVSFIDNAAVEIGTPYLETDLPQLNFAQSADVLYICHQSHGVRKLERSGHAGWSLTEVEFDDGPYLKENTTSTTLRPSARTGTGITITASATDGINKGRGFLATDIGRLVRYKKSSKWGTAVITAVASTTSVTADVIHNFETSPTAKTTWRLGAWSETSGYPGIVYFFEQRLGFAGATDQPQTFWLSQSADFENMTPDNRDDANDGTVEDDDAIDYTISADQVNVIRWMLAYQGDLLIGTAGGEWTVRSSGPVLTPTDIDVKRQTAYGSSRNDPALMRGRLMYLQKARRKILELAYDAELDGVQSLDMTLLSDHVSIGGLESMAYQQELDSTLWTVRCDGVMPAFTYQPDQNVIGWSRQILGGAFRGSNAAAESVTVVPGANRDETWIVCKRTINGGTCRYVEFFEAAYDSGDDQSDAFYVDSGLSFDQPISITGATQADPVVITAAAHGYSNGDAVRIDNVVGMTELNSNGYVVANATADTFELQTAEGGTVDGASFTAYGSGGQVRKKVSTMTGLDHLEGQTVKVLADGAVHADRIVGSGRISLDAPAARVQCGLGYRHSYESLKWEAGSPQGTAQGQTKRIDGVTLMLMNSLNARVGPTESNLQTVPFRDVSDDMDSAVPLFSGEKYAEFDGDYDTDTRVCIQGEDPVPFTLLAVSPRIKVNTR